MPRAQGPGPGTQGHRGALRTQRDCREQQGLCRVWHLEELALLPAGSAVMPVTDSGHWGLQSLQGVGQGWVPQWAAVTSAPQLPLRGVVGSRRSVESSCLIRGI